jgi:cupin 2 domain-containing protein
MIVNNILAGIRHTSGTTDEQTDTLLQHPAFELQRIVSSGNTTPAGQWYDQDRDEWVLVVRGRATLTFDNDSALLLNPGDHVHIPAHCRHRVEWTDPQCETVWLALHYMAT